MSGTKYKVSSYIPKIGFLVERYSGNLNKKETSFSCIVSFSCPVGIPATDSDIEKESLLYANEVCAALNAAEAAKRQTTCKRTTRKRK
jgi:hypothetical protein